MDVLFYIALPAIAFLLGWILRPARHAEWKTIDVDPTGKGPNVDAQHFEIETDEGVFRFTDHEKARAKTRAPGTYDYR
jgi:hypothetical protein